MSATEPSPQIAEVTRANLIQVRKLYGEAELVEALRPLFAFTNKERDWALRHHDLADIEPHEIPLRQTLDELLHICGVINVGWCAGVLSETEQPRIPEGVRGILELAEVHAYFSERYPLPHMASFLLRAADDLPRSTIFEPAWFSALLRLDADFRDSRLFDFLLVVDAYWLDDDTVNFATLSRAVEDGDRIIDAITTPSEERSTLQSAIFGLERFLAFCDDLQALLNAAPSKSGLSEAAFQLYEYWFIVRGQALSDLMDTALAALAGTGAGEVPAGSIPHSVFSLFLRAQTDLEPATAISAARRPPEAYEN